MIISMTGKMICNNCINLEKFGNPETDVFFNKCALLDIYNLQECNHCEFFEDETITLEDVID